MYSKTELCRQQLTKIAGSAWNHRKSELQKSKTRQFLRNRGQKNIFFISMKSRKITENEKKCLLTQLSAKQQLKMT